MYKYIRSLVISIILSMISLSCIWFFSNKNNITNKDNHLYSMVCTDLSGICFYDSKDDSFKGIEIDILKKVAKKMQLKIQFHKEIFEKLILTMKNKGDNYVGAGHCSITPLRENSVIFSDPYIEDEIGIVFYKHLPTQVDQNKLSHLINKKTPIKIVVQTNTSDADYIEDKVKSKTVISGISLENVEIKKVASTDIMFHVFQTGQYDILVTSKKVFESMPNNNELKFEPIAKNKYAFVFGNKSSKKFQDDFNQVLKTILQEK